MFLYVFYSRCLFCIDIVKKKVMKKSVYTLMVLVYLLFYSTNLISQCTNGTNYYPSTIYEPVDGVWGSASSCNWAGEVIRVNVKNGDSYEISTCDTYGGTIAEL